MRHIPSKLFTALVASLGHESAVRELSWIKQHLHSHILPNAPSLEDMIRRRLRGEPLQYILGTQPFGSLDLLVRPPTLIPRPETENWTIQLANFLSPTQAKPIKTLDLCTGSGCIPLLLSHLWPPGSSRAIGVDVSKAAIQLARENATRCGVSDFSPCDTETKTLTTRNTVKFLRANILEADFVSSLSCFDGLYFDLVTSNPPYISRAEYDQLPSSVKDYEDARALLGDPQDTSGGRGLSFYRAIARLVGEADLVKNDGMIVLEVGHDQSEEVQDMMATQGRMRRTDIWFDPWGKKRVVVAWK